MLLNTAPMIKVANTEQIKDMQVRVMDPSVIISGLNSVEKQFSIFNVMAEV